MLHARQPTDDDAFDTAPPLPPPSPSLPTPEAAPTQPVAAQLGDPEGTGERRRRSALAEEAHRLGAEMLARQRERRDAPMRSPVSAQRHRRMTLADFIASAERTNAERTAREEARKVEEHEYRRARYAREKALKASRASGDGLPASPPPVSPAGRRREAERVAREQEHQRLLALIQECRSPDGTAT